MLKVINIILFLILYFFYRQKQISLSKNKLAYHTITYPHPWLKVFYKEFGDLILKNENEQNMVQVHRSISNSLKIFLKGFIKSSLRFIFEICIGIFSLKIRFRVLYHFLFLLTSFQKKEEVRIKSSYLKLNLKEHPVLYTYYKEIWDKMPFPLPIIKEMIQIGLEFDSTLYPHIDNILKYPSYIDVLEWGNKPFDSTMGIMYAKLWASLPHYNFDSCFFIEDLNLLKSSFLIEVIKHYQQVLIIVTNSVEIKNKIEVIQDGVYLYYLPISPEIDWISFYQFQFIAHFLVQLQPKNVYVLDSKTAFKTIIYYRKSIKNFSKLHYIYLTDSNIYYTKDNITLAYSNIDNIQSYDKIYSFDQDFLDAIEDKYNLSKESISLINTSNKTLEYSITLLDEEINNQKYIPIVKCMVPIVLKNIAWDYVFVTHSIGVGGSEYSLLCFLNTLIKKTTNILLITTEPIISSWKFKLDSRITFIEFGVYTTKFSHSDKLEQLYYFFKYTNLKNIHCIYSSIFFDLIVKYGDIITQNRNFSFSVFSEYIHKFYNFKFGFIHTYLLDVEKYTKNIYSDNQTFLNTIQNNWSVNQNKLKVIYHPIHFTKNILKFYQGSKVLWASRFSYEKRLDILLKIVKKLPHLHFDIYGDTILGCRDFDLKQNILQLSKCKNVTLKGKYNGFDSIPHNEYFLFLYTTQYDGMPNVLLEATASGLPIIAPNIGGISELVINKTTGLLLEKNNDIQGYVEGIQFIKDNPEIAKTYWDNAYKIIQERHTQESFEKRLEEINY